MAPLVTVKPRDDSILQRLNPVVSITGKAYFLSAAEMASVPVSELSEAVDNLGQSRDELIAAVDLLFTAI